MALETMGVSSPPGRAPLILLIALELKRKAEKQVQLRFSLQDKCQEEQTYTCSSASRSTTDDVPQSRRGEEGGGRTIEVGAEWATMKEAAKRKRMIGNITVLKEVLKGRRKEGGWWARRGKERRFASPTLWCSFSRRREQCARAHAG